MDNGTVGLARGFVLQTGLFVDNDVDPYRSVRFHAHHGVCRALPRDILPAGIPHGFLQISPKDHNNIDLDLCRLHQHVLILHHLQSEWLLRSNLA